MVFDDRHYIGAQPVSPLHYHAGAPAVGDLCAQAMRAGYFFPRHQATLIGSQTYQMRFRRQSAMQIVDQTTPHRIAEWCAVHLAAHHTHVIAEVWIALTRTNGYAEIRSRLIATDNTTTVTGSNTVLEVPAPDASLQVNGHPVHVSLVSVDISTLTRPTESARVYVESHALVETGASCAMAPMLVTAWRRSE